MTANLYIIEDHSLMQRAMTEFLDRVPDLHVCGTATTAQQALAQLPTMKADLALIDLSLPDMDGIALLRALQQSLPGLPCLLYSSYQEATYVRQAQAAGAYGYLFKGEPHELIDAIRHVLRGEHYWPEPFRRQVP